MATERTRLLVDAGLSRKETFERLAASGVEPESLSAILVTHEHTDHIAGVQTIARKLRIPVYISRLTAPAVAWDENPPALELFQSGSSFTIGDIDVTSFTVPHDAADPVGFSLRAQGIKVSIATDLGYIPPNVKAQLKGVDLLLLESNHDIEMLRDGPYPWSVKQRVLSRVGHLSNEAAATYLETEYDGQAAYVVLAHLSESNNLPDLARISAERALNGRASLLANRLLLAAQHEPMTTICF